MDYSILKQLEPLPYYMFPKQRHFSLPSNPHIDYVNPGVGFATKIHDFYLPIFGQNYKYSIQKKDSNDIEISISNQEGKGIDEEDLEPKDLDKKLNVESSVSLPNASKELDNSKPTHAKKRLNDGIYEAFMHPKIKTAKLTFPLNNEKEKNVNVKTSNVKKSQKMSHKFNVV